MLIGPNAYPKKGDKIQKKLNPSKGGETQKKLNPNQPNEIKEKKLTEYLKNDCETHKTSENKKFLA